MSIKLYKFRALQDCIDLDKIEQIINDGFYCSSIFDFNDMNEGVYTNNEQNTGVTLAEKLNYKICSFSGEEALNSELMWGHYANAGKGIAIEVTVTDNITDNITDLYQVKYAENKEDLNNIIDILTNKSTAWEYEKEWRSIKEQSDKTIQLGKITKIYFGTPYKCLKNYDKIKEENTYLQKYLKLKDELENYCQNHKDTILCEDYDFNLLF